jgi:hypothetical protein
MKHRKRALVFGTVAVISLLLLAAPARGDEWFGLSVGSGGFALSFGSTNWSVYGSSWSNPGWRVDYHVALSGYGEWVWVDGLGQCWRPWVSTGWRPYTHGRWIWTSYGWTWLAYEPWGYFPHHYGHWAFSGHGWVWSPGYTYRAANVTWVHAGGYIGWYARPPAGWSHASRGYHRGYNHGHHDGYRRGYDHGYWDGWDDARYATYSSWSDLGAADVSTRAVPVATVRSRSTNGAVRLTAAAPDRSDMRARGVALPERTMEHRTVRIADRDVTLARPDDVVRSIQTHAGRTVDRALDSKARQTAASRPRNSGPQSNTSPRSADRSDGRMTRRGHAAASNRSLSPDASRTRAASSARISRSAHDPATRTRAAEPRGSDDARSRHRSIQSRPPKHIANQREGPESRTTVSRQGRTSAAKPHADARRSTASAHPTARRSQAAEPRDSRSEDQKPQTRRHATTSTETRQPTHMKRPRR